MNIAAASVHKALSLAPAQSRSSGDIGAVARGSSSPSSALAVTSGNAIDPPTRGGKIPRPQGCSSSCNTGSGRENGAGDDVLSALAALMQKFSEAQEMAR